MNGDLGRGRVHKVRELAKCEVCTNKSRDNVELTYPLHGYEHCGGISSLRAPKGRTLRICARCAAELAQIAERHQGPPTD